MLVARADRDRDERAQLEPLGADAARAQPLLQRTRDRREHDVVDGAAERVLDALEVAQVLADPDEPAMRADLDVERGRRRGVERGPHDLAEPLERLARLLQRLARVQRGVDDAAGRLERQRGDAADAARRELEPARRRVRGPDRRRMVGPHRHRAEVEQDGREVDAGDAVDERVVGLGDQREPAALEPLDEPHLPQRLGAVERLRVDPRRERAQLRLGPRHRQRGVADVVLEVEARIVDPQRPAGLDGREGELLAEARDEVEPRADVVREVVVGGRGAVEDHHRADVHVRHRAFLGDERRVDGGQAISVLLRHVRQPTARRSAGRPQP